MKFHINYAYNGFLYAPLILAEHLKLLPRDAELKPREGDVRTLQSLGVWHDPHENWFAVCDPFATDITKLVLPPSDGEGDAVCIVGALVGRLPVWLYSLDSDFKRISSEGDLEKSVHRVKRIVCYEKFNTGYLIGKRINDLVFPGDDKTHPVKFGDELKNVTAGDLVVTSDVLRVAQSQKLDDGHVVFDYFAHCCDLDPFLFTAILTLRSVVKNHLNTVLSVLKGLQEATFQFETGNVSRDGVSFLVSKFGEQMPAHLSDADRQVQVEDAIELLRRDRIYSGYLDIDNAEKGYEKAREAWLSTLKRKYGPVERHKEPIPSLLIKRDWSQHPPLARAFAESWKLQSPVSPSQRTSASVVSAVAETWRDHAPTITAITENWLSSSTTKALLEQMVCKPAAFQAQATEVPALIEEYHRPVVIVGLAQLSLLVVGLAALLFGGQLTVAGPTILAMLLLALSGLLLVSHWDPQNYNQAFWSVASVSYLGQLVLTVWIWRDAFFREETEHWGHHEGVFGAILVIVALFATPHAAEPYKERLPKTLKNFLPRREAD
jgi:hypothetical protein